MVKPPDAALVRGLRRWDLVALVINSVIGAGIFGVPSRVFALAGTYSVAAYVAAAVAIVFVILCFAEVGSRFSTTGGPYLYARATFGPLIGFQVGWLLWLGRVAAFASAVNLFVGYVGYVFPAVGGAGWRVAVSACLISVLAGANIRGVRLTAAVTNVLTVGKLIPLFLLSVVGLHFVDSARYSLASPPSYASFSQAALILVFTYMGFEGASIPAGEMRDPRHHLPFALLIGIGTVTLLYISVQIVCIGTVPDLTHSERPLADASVHFLGAPGASLIAAGALVSIVGVLNALMFATPRLLFAMSENGQLPRILSATHPRFRTPVAAVVLTAATMFALALSSTFISALTISAVVRLIAYTSTCAALPVLRRHRDLPQPSFVAPVGPVSAVMAIGLSVWLISNSPMSELRVAGVAVLLGFILYWAGRRSRATPGTAAALLESTDPTVRLASD